MKDCPTYNTVSYILGIGGENEKIMRGILIRLAKRPRWFCIRGIKVLNTSFSFGDKQQAMRLLRQANHKKAKLIKQAKAEIKRSRKNLQ